MQSLTEEEIKKLAKDPLSFAAMMDDSQIEDVIVAFVSVLLARTKHTR